MPQSSSTPAISNAPLHDPPSSSLSQLDPIPTSPSQSTPVPHSPSPSTTTLAQPSTLNLHPMQTRSKSGIIKTNSKLCYKAVLDYNFAKPPTYKIVSKPKWCEAMDVEFQALQR